MTSATYEKKKKEDYNVELKTKSEFRRPSGKEVAACKPCRLCLVGTFLLFLIGLLVASIVLIAITDKCKTTERVKKSNIFAYQVYVKSFQDSDNDGEGDVNGLKAKLSYIKNMGTKVIVLNDAVGKKDLKLDLNMGDIKGFKKLVSSSKEQGMKVLIQMNPVVVADDNEWFIESKQKNSKHDWFIWRDANFTNNWKSVSSGSAWHGAGGYRNQSFYSHFGASLPTLNYYSSEVVGEVTKILNWWLDLGVDGFVLTSISRLVVDKKFRSNNGNCSYDKDLPYSHKILANLFQTIHQRGGVVWVVPRTNVKESVKYFGNKDNQEADVVLNDDFALLKSSSLTAKRLNESLSTYLKDQPSFGEIGWMMGGTSYTRLASRFSSAQSKLMSLFLLTLPHVVLNYYGDELLLQDTKDGKSFAMMKWSNDTKEASRAITVAFSNLTHIRSSMDVFKYSPKIVYAKEKALVMWYKGSTELIVGANFGSTAAQAANVTEALKGKFIFHTDDTKTGKKVDLKTPLEVPANQLFLMEVIE